MDVPATNNTNSRQRSSPANDNQQHHPAQQQQHPQQLPSQHQPTFTYPVQQPQGSWTPSIAAAPFYPSFYQNHQQQPPQPYPAQIPPQSPYFDPANAQLAQWAYQQMMFNAQHGFPPQQRNAASDYFSQNQIPPAFNPFPSGTPPPHQNHRGGAGDHQQQSGQQGQFSGFHPYRRPNRQPQAHSPDGSDRRQGTSGPPHPPYKRPEASGSTSSVNSSTSQRQRTDSNQSGHSGHNTPSSANGSARGRNVSPSVPPHRNSPSPASSSGSSAPGLRVPHHRASSSSSSNSARPSGISPAPPSSTTTTSSAHASSSPAITSPPIATPRPTRPSPLSQGNFTANERRMSRDDSDLGLDPAPSASTVRSGGLKGRLRRALSFNASQALKEEDGSDDESIKASTFGTSSKLKSKTPAIISSAAGKSGDLATPRASTDTGDDGASTATVQTKKKGRAASLFNARLNVSTDNISLSSTVSSASVMIRKLGSMGKLAKRNSLAGIASLFKDKDKKKDKDGKKGSGKAEASEASVSHVTAELDRSSNDWTGGADLNGLSPAAKLARQHTLKTNAEAAAKAKAAQEAAAANSASNPIVNGVNGAGVPTWERNTATRQRPASPVKGGAAVRVNEDGTRVLVEDEEDESDDGHYDGPQQGGQGFHAEGWGDDDEDWEGEGDGDGDEDVTIRVGLERTSIDNEGYTEEVEPWGMNVRRSVERTRRPTKGILKYAESYDQQSYLTDTTIPNRARSNSYNSHPGQTELGPLARIPSPDPDHIDGLHRHTHSSSHTNATAPLLPPLAFDSSMSLDSPTKEPSTPTSASQNQNSAPHPPEKSNAIFNHPNLNSSAPALSTMTNTPMLTHRSATAPHKRLVFASNLSVYDTFPASVYDRRSEPATWSRLTPALAQRIKEELNSYKMEEMEVHAASRIHTQFFV
ncbi:putative to Saccharomyces cerevisiae BNI4 (YNL233W) [Lyophyllum shimeji]|uniref:To Saccharomyces cerevisiae BNI4 (YNL233W) n=1 Tax=Lyophyllum shimeji TaxID=47721 RepID=A0A9P3UJ92_LYOSH|nr:putative to Saccharomyces cerevisiae BNI4 (YNL233W) [Lyophyllum shimeji]